MYFEKNFRNRSVFVYQRELSKRITSGGFYYFFFFCLSTRSFYKWFSQRAKEEKIKRKAGSFFFFYILNTITPRCASAGIKRQRFVKKKITLVPISNLIKLHVPACICLSNLCVLHSRENQSVYRCRQ